MSSYLSDKRLFVLSLLFEIAIPFIWLMNEKIWYLIKCQEPQTVGAALCDQYFGLFTIIASVSVWLPSVFVYLVIALVANKLRKSGSAKARMIHIVLAMVPIATLMIPYVNGWVN